MALTALTKASISLRLLKTLVLTLTVPPGMVPILLCASGAQCSPALTAKPIFESFSPTSSDDLPRRLRKYGNVFILLGYFGI